MSQLSAAADGACGKAALLAEIARHRQQSQSGPDSAAQNAS